MAAVQLSNPSTAADIERQVLQMNSSGTSSSSVMSNTALPSTTTTTVLDGSKTKRHVCLECGKSYTRRSDLKVHERSHTGEKPFECAECGRCFPKRSHLSRHEKTHTGVKPYKCGICGKRHSRACDLKVHLRTHTGERPYSCNVCGKSFVTSSHCRMHERTHNDDRCEPCKFCTKTFKTKAGLRMHMNSNHASVDTARQNIDDANTMLAQAALPMAQPVPVVPATINAVAATSYQTKDRSDCISLKTLAMLCPKIVKQLVGCGLVKHRTKDAGCTTFTPTSATPADAVPAAPSTTLSAANQDQGSEYLNTLLTSNTPRSPNNAAGLWSASSATAASGLQPLQQDELDAIDLLLADFGDSGVPQPNSAPNFPAASQSPNLQAANSHASGNTLLSDLDRGTLQELAALLPAENGSRASLAQNPASYGFSNLQ